MGSDDPQRPRRIQTSVDTAVVNHSELNAVRKSLKHDRTIFDVRPHDVCNAFVIINDVLLPNSLFRKQHLIQPRKLDHAGTETAFTHFGISFTTSDGSLSVRKPR
jgi:hypothetical protein